MGFEISVAAGLVSLHLCDFTPRTSPHTSHVETGNYTELSGTMRRPSCGEYFSSSLSSTLLSSKAQLFKLRSEVMTGVGGVWSENCKENHQVSLPSSDVADTIILKSALKILQHPDS